MCLKTTRRCQHFSAWELSGRNQNFQSLKELDTDSMGRPVFCPGDNSLHLWTARHSPHHTPLPAQHEDRLSATSHARPFSTPHDLSHPYRPCSEMHSMLVLTTAHISGHLLQPFHFTREKTKAQKDLLTCPKSRSGSRPS